MTYPVQIVLDEGNLMVGLREIDDWLNTHAVRSSTLRYKMFADRVQLRIDFNSLKDATEFSEVFGGLVFARSDAQRSAQNGVAELNRT